MIAETFSPPTQGADRRGPLESGSVASRLPDLHIAKARGQFAPVGGGVIPSC
jgi:hypothetical protein